MREKELGDLSLREILVGTYFIQTTTEVYPSTRRAVVSVLSHPKPKIDQQFDLYLVKKDGKWVIHLDKTVEINQVAAPPPGATDSARL